MTTGALTKSVVHPALYATIRTAMGVPTVAGSRASIRAARALGRTFARLPFNRSRTAKAVDRLGVVFPEMDEASRRDLVVRSYEHLFMLGAEIAHIPRLFTEDGWVHHVELDSMGPTLRALTSGRAAILVTGHCGNWEASAYLMALIGFPFHAVYRPLDMKPLDRWVRRTRARRGLHLLDKFGAMHRMPSIIEGGGAIGFVADQNAGDRGVFVPFLGRLASSYKSIGLAAVKMGLPVMVGCARRIGWEDAGGASRGGLTTLGTRDTQGVHYRIIVDDFIEPEDWADQPDPVFYLTARYRRSLEKMVREAPEQYLWMHRMWKSRPRHERLGRPFPDTLREKLLALPWTTEAEVESIVERSERDTRWLAENGTDRLP